MKHALLLLSLIATQTQAQIIYTDVIPDAVYSVNGEICHLDLDNNGSDDFTLDHISGPSCSMCVGALAHLAQHVHITPVVGNSVADTNTYYPSCLKPARLIDNALTWGNATNQPLRGFTVHCISFGTQNICVPYLYSGEWTNASVDSSRYIGLRFTIAGATHYGWARVSIPSNVSTLTVKDYAYNSVPDEPILAGEGADISTNIARIAHPNVQVTPNPFTSTVSIFIDSAKAGVVLCTVHSLTGQVLAARSITASGGHSPFTLDLSSLAPGIYMLEVMHDGERIVRKVMRE